MPKSLHAVALRVEFVGFFFFLPLALQVVNSMTNTKYNLLKYSHIIVYVTILTACTR